VRGPCTRCRKDSGSSTPAELDALPRWEWLVWAPDDKRGKHKNLHLCEVCAELLDYSGLPRRRREGAGEAGGDPEE